jgi:hypothetical protein
MQAFSPEIIGSHPQAWNAINGVNKLAELFVQSQARK